ncbi:uncharacterized protein EV422DRAFT_165143 [Fimicolochytrium jonesii]|uniref:uncharacterized protein n=1 Tax=Fimicolochytrium jonesii TaxID=1396493 RepID=UPI0022FF2205|nr:uncharacterized protein EV422DRAFT_165143 [Fimicolochytrium jonesii]KAI8818791.1 hypothetical protein EV422DRAFT_165143 [Fimicolochytrium jonesii]
MVPGRLETPPGHSNSTGNTDAPKLHNGQYNNTLNGGGVPQTTQPTASQSQLSYQHQYPTGGFGVSTGYSESNFHANSRARIISFAQGPGGDPQRMGQMDPAKNLTGRPMAPVPVSRNNSSGSHWQPTPHNVLTTPTSIMMGHGQGIVSTTPPDTTSFGTSPMFPFSDSPVSPRRTSNFLYRRAPHAVYTGNNNNNSNSNSPAPGNVGTNDSAFQQALQTPFPHRDIPCCGIIHATYDDLLRHCALEHTANPNANGSLANAKPGNGNSGNAGPAALPIYPNYGGIAPAITRAAFHEARNGSNGANGQDWSQYYPPLYQHPTHLAHGPSGLSGLFPAGTGNVDADLSALLANQPNVNDAETRGAQILAQKRTLSAAAFSVGSYSAIELKRIREEFRLSGVDFSDILMQSGDAGQAMYGMTPGNGMRSGMGTGYQPQQELSEEMLESLLAPSRVDGNAGGNPLYQQPFMYPGSSVAANDETDYADASNPQQNSHRRGSQTDQEVEATRTTPMAVPRPGTHAQMRALHDADDDNHNDSAHPLHRPRGNSNSSLSDGHGAGQTSALSQKLAQTSSTMAAPQPGHFAPTSSLAAPIPVNNNMLSSEQQPGNAMDFLIANFQASSLRTPPMMPQSGQIPSEFALDANADYVETRPASHSRPDAAAYDDVSNANGPVPSRQHLASQNLGVQSAHTQDPAMPHGLQTSAPVLPPEFRNQPVYMPAYGYADYSSILVGQGMNHLGAPYQQYANGLVYSEQMYPSGGVNAPQRQQQHPNHDTHVQAAIPLQQPATAVRQTAQTQSLSANAFPPATSAGNPATPAAHHPSPAPSTTSRVPPTAPATTPSAAAAVAARPKAKPRARKERPHGPTHSDSASTVESGDAGTPITADAPTPSTPLIGPAKPHPCPHPNCNKSYKNPNGLKYHLEHGHPELYESTSKAAAEADAAGEDDPKNAVKPFICRVLVDDAAAKAVKGATPQGERPPTTIMVQCEKPYKNLNGLKYHLIHAHGLDDVQCKKLLAVAKVEAKEVLEAFNALAAAEEKAAANEAVLKEEEDKPDVGRNVTTTTTTQDSGSGYVEYSSYPRGYDVGETPSYDADLDVNGMLAQLLDLPPPNHDVSGLIGDSDLRQ